MFLGKRTEGSEWRIPRSNRDVIRTECLAWIIDEQLQSMGGRNMAYPRFACHQKVNCRYSVPLCHRNSRMLTVPDRGQIRLFREFLQPRRPAGHFNPKEYFDDLNAPSLSIIRDPLHETVRMMVPLIEYALWESTDKDLSLSIKGPQWLTNYWLRSGTRNSSVVMVCIGQA